MKNLNKETIKTGAKKVIATTSLVAMLFAGLPTVAYADVNPGLIIGEEQLGLDRSEVKKNDAAYLKSRYNQEISLDEVEKAIELSNLLNGYYFDILNYTNTTPSELVTLDINSMYNNYEASVNAGVVDSFCANNLTNKPACDGYITLSSRGVAKSIENAIIKRVKKIYKKAGYKITGEPKILINKDEISCIIKVNGTLQKMVLRGITTNEIIAEINSLNSIYKTAINNVSGKSKENDGSFIYNGINYLTYESVYFSIADDNKKATIENGINRARDIENKDTYLFLISDPTHYKLSKKEKEQLRKLGYSETEIASAHKEYLGMTKEDVVILTK